MSAWARTSSGGTEKSPPYGRWLDDARAGTGRLVLSAGEPGIGKTRLAQEFAGRALATGMPVAWGRTADAEGAPAFWPWRSVLRALGADPDAVLTGDVESPADRFRLFEEVALVLGRAAGGSGLVVILDDAHWADEPSLLLLRHLAGELVSTPLLVVVTVRSASVPPGLAEVLRVPGAERVDLRPLDLQEVGAQLAALAGADAEVDAATVLEVTGGNPLFVREVAGAIAEGTWRPDRPPGSVLDVVGARARPGLPGVPPAGAGRRGRGRRRARRSAGRGARSSRAGLRARARRGGRRRPAPAREATPTGSSTP